MHDFNKHPELTNSQMQIYYFDSPHKQIFEDFRAKVIKVHDGDTITVRTNFRDFDFPIRFANIAAPELNEEGGHESQSVLEGLILNQKVDILINKDNRVGKWGRLIGEIISQGLSINDDMVRKGFAVPFSQRKESSIPDFNKELKRSVF